MSYVVCLRSKSKSLDTRQKRSGMTVKRKLKGKVAGYPTEAFGYDGQKKGQRQSRWIPDRSVRVRRSKESSKAKSLDTRQKCSGMTVKRKVKGKVAGYQLEACWYDGMLFRLAICLILHWLSLWLKYSFTSHVDFNYTVAV